MAERPGLFMRRTLAGLAPADEDSALRLRKIPAGDLVTVDVKRPRNLAQHRRYWLLCSLVAINHESLADAESVHQCLKLLTGWTDKVALKSTGEILMVPRSISFTKMDAGEWDDYYARARDAVCEHLLPGVALPELEEEILRVAS